MNNISVQNSAKQYYYQVNNIHRQSSEKNQPQRFINSEKMNRHSFMNMEAANGTTGESAMANDPQIIRSVDQTVEYTPRQEQTNTDQRDIHNWS